MMQGTPAFRILTVDDDHDDQQMLKSIFCTLLPSAEIIQAYHGGECLRYLDAHADALPSLITMDLNMPMVNGVEATTRIKASPLVRKIPLVILTTSGWNRDREAAQTSGADDYCIKPMRYEQLEETVQGIITRWLQPGPPLFS